MRILIVEDEHTIANSLKKGLEIESFAVDVAYKGDDGLDLALSEEYDLIILDRMLPGLDGLTISKKLREGKIHTPILMLTAKGQVADRVEGLNSGADDYLPKPFAFEELLARIRALLRRPKDTVQTVLEYNSLVLDPIAFSVKRNNKAIKLSHKEFSLLEYLMRHQERILTKEQIMDHVWDYDANILPNTVEVYIGYLRNKVDKPFPNDSAVIQTIRGFGYRLGGDK